MRDRDRVAVEAGEVELEALDPRHEARQRDDRRGALLGPRPSPSAQLIAVPCEKPPRTSGRGTPSQQLGERLEAAAERLRLRCRDPAEPVPVRAARRQRPRRRAASPRAAAAPGRARRGAGRGRARRRRGRAAGRARPPASPAAGRSRTVSATSVRPGARIRQRRQHRLDLLAQVLERRRQREPLAEVLRILVRREARAERRDLEEHAARLAEVDRAEVEAVDHGRRLRAGRGDPLAPGLVLLHRRGPGDVVDGARAADPALRGRGS